MRQVGFQSSGGQFKFDQDHDVFKSIVNDLVQRGEKKEAIQPGKHSYGSDRISFGSGLT